MSDDDGCDCRPLGFLIGLPFMLVAFLLSLIGMVLWIIATLLACCCPCGICCAGILNLALSLIKAPIKVIRWFTKQIPCWLQLAHRLFSYCSSGFKFPLRLHISSNQSRCLPWLVTLLFSLIQVVYLADRYGGIKDLNMEINLEVSTKTHSSQGGLAFCGSLLWWRFQSLSNSKDTTLAYLLESVTGSASKFRLVKRDAYYSILKEIPNMESQYFIAGNILLDIVCPLLPNLSCLQLPSEMCESGIIRLNIIKLMHHTVSGQALLQWEFCSM